jgi:hypothetical protein
MIGYATKTEQGIYRNVYGHPLMLTTSVDRNATIYKVEITECAEGPYWGWSDPKRPPDYYSMIFIHEMSLDICFPCGYKASQDLGHGRAVRLSIKELGIYENS